MQIKQKITPRHKGVIFNVEPNNTIPTTASLYKNNQSIIAHARLTGSKI
jgi:hypothetical protein